MIRPLAIAMALRLPTFAIFDADTDKVKQSEVEQHRKENRSLQLLLGVASPNEWPDKNVLGDNYCMWSVNLTSVVSSDVPEWDECRSKAAVRYDHCGGLEKNPLAIAFCHELASKQGNSSTELRKLVDQVLIWAQGPKSTPEAAASAVQSPS